MTYCLGILLRTGLILASDSRTNAGVDQIATVSKMSTFETPGERIITVLSAGNLATTQAVISQLKQSYGSGDFHRDMTQSLTLFDAAQKVGDTLREVLNRDASFVKPYGDPAASFLVGGQIRDALLGDPAQRLGGLTHGDRVLERLQVAHQRAAAGRIHEPLAEFAGIVGRQAVVAAVSGQVDHRLGP